MASLKKEKVRNPSVSIKARAVDEGYYKNRIVRIDEVIQFDGSFEKNSEGEYTLPLWLEPVDFSDFEKLSKAAKKEVKAPVAKEVKAPAKVVNASDVMASAGSLV